MKNRLGPGLFAHSLGVEKTAAALAHQWGADLEKARVAAFLHDYGRAYSYEDLEYFAKKMNPPLDEIVFAEPALLHAPVGAWLVKENLGIEDAAVMEAISCHTTGKAEMGKLAKIVYLADLIEPGRHFPGIAKIREIAGKGLDDGVLAAVEHTLLCVLNKGSLIHPDSVCLRNALLLAGLSSGKGGKDGKGDKDGKGGKDGKSGKGG